MLLDNNHSGQSEMISHRFSPHFLMISTVEHFVTCLPIIVYLLLRTVYLEHALPFKRDLHHQVILLLSYFLLLLIYLLFVSAFQPKFLLPSLFPDPSPSPPFSLLWVLLSSLYSLDISPL